MHKASPLRASGDYLIVQTHRIQCNCPTVTTRVRPTSFAERGLVFVACAADIPSSAVSNAALVLTAVGSSPHLAIAEDGLTLVTFAPDIRSLPVSNGAFALAVVNSGVHLTIAETGLRLSAVERVITSSCPASTRSGRIVADCGLDNVRDGAPLAASPKLARGGWLLIDLLAPESWVVTAERGLANVRKAWATHASLGLARGGRLHTDLLAPSLTATLGTPLHDLLRSTGRSLAAALGDPLLAAQGCVAALTGDGPKFQYGRALGL